MSTKTQTLERRGINTVRIMDVEAVQKQISASRNFDGSKAMNARTILLHVISDATYYSSLNYSPIMGFGGFSNVDTIETDTAAELKRVAQNYLKKSKEYLGDEMIETVVSNGDFAETILKTATRLNVDIIVMGTHSRRGLEKILMGSVAEKVLRHSLIPMFIIPTKAIEEK